MLDRLKARDPLAQQEAARTLYPRLLRLCLAELRDEGLAEQTASDLWTDFLFAEVDNLRREGAEGAYLRMMAVRRCRRIRAFRDRHDAPIQERAHGSEEEIVARLDTRRQVADLTLCLETLNPRVRRVLRMRFHLGMSGPAIGEALSVSKQYAGRLIALGLDGLRQCMERDDARDRRAGTAA